MLRNNLLIITLLSFFSFSFANQQDIDNGYNYQNKQNNQIFIKKSTQLDELFKFKELAKNGQLPPSLWCKDNYILGKKISNECIIYPSKNFKLDSKSEEILTWRDFLLVLANPEATVLNLDNLDFKKGVQKSIQLAEFNISNLEKVYAGMIYFRDLEAKGLLKNKNISSLTIEVIK